MKPTKRITKNPVYRKSLGEKKNKLENSERKKMEDRKRKEELEKRIKRPESDWRDLISEEKIEEITKRLPQKEWHKLSFYKQLLEFLERQRIQAFQGSYI